jgi:hypothetical protein
MMRVASASQMKMPLQCYTAYVHPIKLVIYSTPKRMRSVIHHRAFSWRRSLFMALVVMRESFYFSFAPSKVRARLRRWWTILRLTDLFTACRFSIMSEPPLSTVVAVGLSPLAILRRALPF